MRMKALLTAFAAVLAAGLQAAVPVEWQSDVTKPEAKMPRQNTNTPDTTIHFRLRRSAATPANGTESPYTKVKTVATMPMPAAPAPSEPCIEVSVAPNICRVPCCRKNATHNRASARHL